MSAVLEQEPTALKIVALDFGLIRKQALATFDLQRESVERDVAAARMIIVTDDATRKVAKKEHWKYVKFRTGLDAKKKTALEDTKKIVAIVGEVADSFQSEFDKAEEHLAGQIDAYDAKIESERQAKLDAAYNVRNAKLIAAGVTLDRLIVDSLTDEQIDQRCSEALELARLRKAEAERLAAEKAEADRLAAEQAEANRIEAERLAAERAEFDRQKAEQQAETDRLKKIEEEQLAKERAQFLAEKAESDRLRKVEDDKLSAQQSELDRQKKLIDEANEKLQRAEDERVANIERLKAEEEERIAHARKIEDERLEMERRGLDRQRREQEAAAKVIADQQTEQQRLIDEANEKLRREEFDRLQAIEDSRLAEELRPDREKLLAFADSLCALPVPSVSAKSEVIRSRCIGIVTDCAVRIREIVANPN